MSAAAGPPPGFRAKLALARAAGTLSRRSGRGGGTTLPGRLLLRIAPDAVSRLGGELSEGATIVSATNGKTTTAGMIAAALEAAGRRPVHNRAGSNMSWGVATALLEQSGSEGLFEVDEAWLPRMAAELDDGLLDVGTCGNVSKLRFMRGIAKLFKGEHREVLEVEEFRTAEVTVEADRPFVVYADGDPIADLPATITLLPRALRVLAPE